MRDRRTVFVAATFRAVLALLVLILPGSVRAQSCSCPLEELAGFPLGDPHAGPPLFCSYPASAGENPNDFFCTYDANTGTLIQDHDAGFCPATAVDCPISTTTSTTETTTTTTTSTTETTTT